MEVAKSEDKSQSVIKPIQDHYDRRLQVNIMRRNIKHEVPKYKDKSLVIIRRLNTDSQKIRPRNAEVLEIPILNPIIEKHEPKLLLCDEYGSLIKDYILKDFLEGEYADSDEFGPYVKNIVEIRAQNDRSVNTISTILNSEDTLISNVRAGSTPKYNKLMKGVDIRYRNRILNQLFKAIPDTYSNKLRTICNALEVLIDKRRDIIIRIKRKGKRSIIDSPIRKKLEGIKYSRPITDTTLEDNKQIAIPRVYEEDSLRMESKKPAAKIMILHKDYEHLRTHEINQAINLVNKFISLTFKNKDTNYDTNSICALARIMKLQLKRKDIVETTFRNREISYNLKEQITNYLSSVINYSGNFNSSEVGNRGLQYKFFIGSGNNGIMIRNVLKQRWWWIYGAKNDENLNLLWTQWYKPKSISKLPCFGSPNTFLPRITNHFEQHYHLSNKKAMFINLKRYYQAHNIDPFIILPLTFHIRQGTVDTEFNKFLDYYNKLKEEIESKKCKGKKNAWIIKPGEYSNRGCGISVTQSIEEIKGIIGDGKKRQHTYILQKYIEKPLLINRRKFDIRMFGLLTSVNGIIKGYFYEEGYIRTSCKEYTLNNFENKVIHLTNDAVQQKDEEYGKYESGNKLSFNDFQRYLDTYYTFLNIDFFRDLLPQIRVIVYT